MHALRLGVTQRRQRVGGLAGLRNEDRKIALAQRRLAVAEFGGHVDLDRQAAQALEPVFGDVTGVASGTAGDDRNALNILEVERQGHRQRHAVGRHVDIARQGVADDFRLLVNLLGHEVAIIRLVDQRRRSAVLDRVAMHDRVVLVVDDGAAARQHDPVAILEVSDGVGERAERDGVRTEIHLALAITDRERRPVARADHQIVVAGKNERKGEGAPKP